MLYDFGYQASRYHCALLLSHVTIRCAAQLLISLLLIFGGEGL